MEQKQIDVALPGGAGSFPEESGVDPMLQAAGSKTDEWLLYCLRAGPDKTGGCGAAPLSEADWAELLQQLARHRVAPLFYHRLRTFHPGLPVPPGIMQKLRQACLENAARNLMLYDNLGKVLKLLRRDGIPVIALKGAHLGELVYGDRDLRFMGDLDLLVKQDDLMRVDALLLGMGCVPNDHSRIVGKDNNEFVYVMPKRDVSLEMHWRILSSRFPFRIDTDGQWARARPVRIAGVDAAVFCPEDLLLHLCLHAACTHGFEPGLRLLCDISAILRHDGKTMDWALVQRLAREWGIGKSVYLTLKLTGDLMGEALPEGLMAALRPGDFDDRFVALATDQIFSRKRRTGQPLSMWPAVARFWGAASLREKMVLFMKGFFLPREAMARLYPVPAGSLRIYFYYLVRLRDLLRVYGRDVWRWLRRDRQMRAFAKEGQDLTTLKDWLMSP